MTLKILKLTPSDLKKRKEKSAKRKIREWRRKKNWHPFEFLYRLLWKFSLTPFSWIQTKLRKELKMKKNQQHLTHDLCVRLLLRCLLHTRSEPQANVFLQVFSNDRSVLWQYNTWLYLLNIFLYRFTPSLNNKACFFVFCIPYR